MNRIRNTCLLLLVSCFCFSQNAKIDSLKKLLKTQQEDSNKVSVLNNLCWEIAKTGGYFEAVQIANEALVLAEKLKNKKGTFSALNNLGVFYGFQGNYPKALEYFLKALKLAEEINNKKGIAKALNNIGNIYNHQNEYAKAMEYFLKAIKAAEQTHNMQSVAISLGNIGSIYGKQHNNKKALEFFFKAQKINEEQDDLQNTALGFNNIGEVYFQEGDYSKTMEYYLKALELRQKLGDKKGIATTLNGIGLVYLEQKKYFDAISYCSKSLSIAKEIGSIEEIKSASEILSSAYEQTHQTDKALENYKQFILMRDSVYNKENIQKLIQAEMNYEFDKQQTADSIKNAEETKQQELKHNNEILQQKIYTYSGAIGFLLMIIVAVVSFRGYRQKQKANELLEVKNEVIEEKNKDITDSITYAKRIQDAMLPSLETENKLFSDSFILFRPRDIVSGDFYWFTEKNGRKIIAAVDCTGHGVPGAFMSMIGNAFLNEIINERGITEPGKILSELRFLVISALKQTGAMGEMRDGMDIALVSIENNNVEFAGAYNPVWIIRSGENKMEEIKADKRPIGYFKGKGLPFSNHKFEIKKGDSLYLFTDGYADQFGGPQGKKFKYKQLEEKLLTVCKLPMEEQKNILEKTFDDWKGNLEQLDDVCVIGIRL